MNVIRIKRGENILTKNITLMAGELALDTVSGVLYTSLTDNGNPVEIKGAASGTVSKAETADYASKLATAQLIKLTGDVSGEASFDGTKAAEITATLKNIVTGATVNGITFNAKGLITGAETVVYKVEDIDGLTEALAGKVDKVTGKSLIDDTEIARLKNVSNYNDTEVRGLITQNAQDIDAIEKAIGEIDIPTALSELTNDTNFITMSQVEAKKYITASEIPTDYVTEAELEGKKYLVASDIAGKADKTELHSHDNKDILDATTASYTTAEKTKLAGLSNYDDAAVLAELDKKANRSALNSYTTTENLNVLLAEKADKADTLAEYGITDAYTKTEVDGMVAGTFHFKGEKASLEELNALTGMKEGDVYQVGEKEYAYNGTAWVELGFNIDLSAYAKTADVAATYATITNLNKKANSADVYTKSDVYTKTEADAAFMSNAEVEAKGYATTTAMNTALEGKADKGTTLAAYGITNAYTKTEADAAFMNSTEVESAITAKGYATTTAMNNALSTKANSADVYTKTAADSTFLKSVPAEYVTETELSNELKAYAKTGTTLEGYGITNGLSTSSVIDGGTF
jgi:hypothetical protein